MNPTVLYFLTSSVRGGVEEHVLSLIKHVDRQRFSVILVCPQPLLGAFERDLVGVAVERVPLHVGRLTPSHLVNAVRLYRFLRRRKPEIVNCHLLRSTLIGVPLAALARVPVIIETFHGREAQREGKRGIKGSYLLDRLVNRLATRVIAVSEASKRHLVEAKRFDAHRIDVVRNGRDLREYRPLPPEVGLAVRRELGIDAGAPLLGVVARLDEQKGHEHLLAALPEVRERHRAIRLLLVGDGKLRERLEARARELGVASSVIFAGFRSDVSRMLTAMDIVVLPSLFEGLPLTVIEASAMGKPVVATAVDGTPEVVADGVTGLLVPPADPGALAQAIIRLLDDPELARRLGEQGLAFARERFDLSRQVRETEQVYERALAAVGRPGHKPVRAAVENRPT